MKGNKHIIGGIALLTLTAVLLTGAAAVTLTDGTVAVDDPANETVEVDVEFSGQDTVTANLTKDGSTVRDDSVSNNTGTETLNLEATGLAANDYNLSVDDVGGNTSLIETRMRTTRSEVLNITENQTVEIDVAFDAQNETTSNVTLIDESGTEVNESTLTFDPVEAEDGSGFETATFVADGDHGNSTIEVVTSAVYGYDGVFIGDRTGGGGGGSVDDGDLFDFIPDDFAISGLSLPSLPTLTTTEWMWVAIAAVSIGSSFVILRRI